MKEILLTSSVLILALLLLRRVFRKRISRRLQYALWGLVLLRLLVPANLPAADFSVLSAAAPVIGEADGQVLYIRPTRETVSAPEDTDPLLVTPFDYHFAAMGPPSSDNTRTVTDENQVTHQLEYERQIDLGAVCRPVWFGGMGVMALWLLASNLGFWGKLRRKRVPMELPECKYPVYLVEEGLASPCLFGLFRPAVYLTPAAMETEESLRHVLAHEETHGRQKDPLWALLRGVCLAVYWFDPLVWRAAAAAREDCELACDEGTLRRLGEDERIPYGQTLLRLIPVRRSMGGALITATTMTSDKKRLKERITRIAENRKMRATALCAAMAVMLAVCAVTFTGCVAAAEPVETAVPAAPVNTVDPAEPVLTIPLTDLVPYEPVPVVPLPVEELFPDHHHNGHHSEEQDQFLVSVGNMVTDGYSTFVWRWRHGENLYVSLQPPFLSSFPDSYFLWFPEQEYREEPFTGLLGYDGLKISYQAELETGECTVNDYYIFEEAGDGVDIRLLARTYGQSETADLDGDGELELIATDFLEHCQLIFRRDGQLYEADVKALVHENWPGTGDFTGFQWSAEESCLDIFYNIYSSDNRQDRQLRFDGKDLVLYEWFKGGI